VGAGGYSLEKMVRSEVWKDRTVLVTGANGFIGSWITEGLVRQKACVVAIVRDILPEAGLSLLNIADKVSIVNGSITDHATVERTFNEYEIDTCFHLAAQAIVGTATRSPVSTFESNIRGTWTVLEACRASKILGRVVVASSDKAYGAQEKLPYTEESPLHGIYPYDASKVCTDVLARSYFATYGIPIAVTRCANTYGGGDLNFSRIIPDAIRCLLSGKTFEIRSDGTLERDYIYVKDIVNAYLGLAERMEKAKGEAFNFGTGKPISVLELFKKITEAVGVKAKPRILGTAKSEIDRQYLESTKARNLLGWEPEYTLDEGLDETVKWYRKYF
jgi:CDP-glucose 4,6-dehydratase